MGVVSKRKQSNPSQKKARKIEAQEVSFQQPFWYQPEAPLGSAVRYLASLSSSIQWVGIYQLEKLVVEMGSRSPTQTPQVLPIQVKDGSIQGEIRIQEREGDSFLLERLQIVRQLAKELGELWPDQEPHSFR